MKGLSYDVSRTGKVGGGTVFLPVPEGLEYFNAASVGESVSPRFHRDGCYSTGWAVARKGVRNPFAAAGSTVVEAAYYILPGSGVKKQRVGETVTEKDYQRWMEWAKGREARIVGDLVVDSLLPLVGAREGKLVECAGDDYEGYVFVCGKCQVNITEVGLTTYYFSVAIPTTSSTWGMCVYCKREGEDCDDIPDKALSMAKGFFYLNRDARLESRKNPDGALGPWRGDKVKY